MKDYPEWVTRAVTRIPTADGGLIGVQIDMGMTPEEARELGVYIVTQAFFAAHPDLVSEDVLERGVAK